MIVLRRLLPSTARFDDRAIRVRQVGYHIVWKEESDAKTKTRRERAT